MNDCFGPHQPWDEKDVQAFRDLMDVLKAQGLTLKMIGDNFEARANSKLARERAVERAMREWRAKGDG